MADNRLAAILCGEFDQHLRTIERHFSVGIAARGNEILLVGEDEARASVVKLLERLTGLVVGGNPLTENDVAYAIELVKGGEEADLSLLNQVLLLTSGGRPIKPRTLGQAEYLRAIRENPLVLGIGPAGTGKSYLAVAAAVNALKERQVARIVLTRPAVEAGEKLGFLPGDLQEKVDPYLRPLYDALYDVLGEETFFKYRERGIVEIAPLAYMRGRTLDDSFVILDEAQNTTSEQMKMFLTRLGFASKGVVTGDITQIDLPRGTKSGLVVAKEVLCGIPGIATVVFSQKDVVRHPLVQKIIQAYEVYERRVENLDGGQGKNLTPLAGRDKAAAHPYSTES